MTALAIISDVEAGLGRSLTAEEIPRANSLLSLASVYVQSAPVSGYRFAPGAYTVGRMVPRMGVLKLPAKVDTVLAVRRIDQFTGEVTSLTGWTWHGSKVYRLGYLSGQGLGVYGLPGQGLGITYGLARSRLPLFVEVDFTVTASVPDEVATLVAGIVASTLSGPPVGASAEHAGPFTLSYVNSSGKVWLSASDKAILGRYKQPKPAIDMTSHGI
jgi:hypothetical protein